MQNTAKHKKPKHKKGKSMKKNREIDLAEPQMGEKYHTLEISLAGSSLAVNAEWEPYCASHWVM